MKNKKTLNNNLISLAMMSCLVLTTACTTSMERPQPGQDASACYIIYDAGSSETRLFIYEETATGWLKHKGPETDALSDPIRRNRGKSMSDLNTVIADVLIALEDIRSDGPPGKNGEPEWPAFDWKYHCKIQAVAVYATAGMRVAEIQDARNSALLWKKLNKRLSKNMGMDVTTRTLTEYEEGLYAWLALRESETNGDFGVAEMGGVSLQMTFPCPFCETARPVRVKDQILPVFSYSFLGWGQDAAWQKSRSSRACAWGAGLKNKDWRVDNCEAAMLAFQDAAADVSRVVKSSIGFRWYLTSAFRYMQDTDIDNYCRKGMNSGFEPESSCFRGVYLQYVLNTFALPPDSEPSDVNWTLGAVVCSVTRCLDVE